MYQERLVEYDLHLKQLSEKRRKNTTNNHLNGKMQSRKHKIMCVETGETFNTVTEAKKKYNSTGIHNVIDNPNRTSAGYHWVSVVS